MGTTTKGLPYPEGTDLLRDGDNAIKALADAIDLKILTTDTAWTNMTLTNSWVNYDSGLATGGSGRTAMYRRLAGVVYIKGIIRSGALGTVFCTMPVGFRWTARAADDWYQPCVAASAFGFITGMFNPPGALSVGGGSTAWVDLDGVQWAADA